VNVAERPLAGVFAAVGLAVAGYLTLVHYAQGQVPLACASSGLVNCDLVTSSAQSTLGPAPVALLGLVWFAGMLALVAFEERLRQPGLLLAELVWTAGGLLVVLYLVFAELFLIGAICSWCTLVHLVVVTLFLLTVFRVAGATGSSTRTH
jgi:uncharacterized membrane protein